jgi:hypothetical protein
MGICFSNKQDRAEKPHIHKVRSMQDNVEKTILECKITRDKIKSYIKSLDKNDALKKEKAKASLKSKDKERAKIYLKQSKMYREQAVAATGQLNLIEDQIIQIETIRQQADALKVLQQGNKVLKQLSDEVNIQKWEQVADDLNDLKQQQEEIGNFFKNRGIDEDAYEEEIDKEMEKLMKQENVDIELSLPEAKENFDKINVQDRAKTKDEHQKIEVAIFN